MDASRKRRLRGNLTAAVLLAVGSAVGFLAVYLVTVRTTPGREFGDASLRGALLIQDGVARTVDSALGVVSAATLLAGLALIVLIALVRLRRVSGLTAAALLVTANGATWLLKTQLLSRPDLGLSEVTPATHNSLPSGHTTAVFSVAVALMIVVPARLRRPLGLVGGVFAVLIALATMSAGWHRAGDSIAAFLNVGFWAGVASGVMVLAAGDAPPDPAPPPLAPQWRRLLISTFLIATVVGLLLVLALVAISSLRSSPPGAAMAFLAGGLLILAAAVSVMVAHLFVLDRSTFAS